MIIKIFTLAIILFISFKLINLILRKINFSKSNKHHLNYLLPFIEFIIALSFISWVVILALQEKNHFVLSFLAIAFILLIIPTLILIRDFIFGLFLKAQNKIQEGATIKIEDINGIITNAGLFFLNIKDSHGNVKSIGYYQLKSKVISTFGENKELEKLIINLDLPIQANMSQFADKLNIQLLNIPWVAVSKPPIIESIKTENELLKVKLTIFTLNKKYSENIRLMINEQFK